MILTDNFEWSLYTLDRATLGRSIEITLYKCRLGLEHVATIGR